MLNINVINYANNSEYIQMIYVSGVFTQDNQYLLICFFVDEIYGHILL